MFIYIDEVDEMRFIIDLTGQICHNDVKMDMEKAMKGTSKKPFMYKESKIPRLKDLIT